MQTFDASTIGPAAPDDFGGIAGFAVQHQILNAPAAGALVIGFVIATGRWFVEARRKGAVPAVQRYRQNLGRVILIGLEVLIAATIIKTVMLEPTFDGMSRLAIMVAIRTILGWTTVLEISGRWPWQSPDLKRLRPR